jgi:hypothetical protein
MASGFSLQVRQSIRNPQRYGKAADTAQERHPAKGPPSEPAA